MADNLRRAVQDLDLGVEDEPFALPADVLHQAAYENRFVLWGRATNPRRQNIRSIIANMPRIWSLEGLIFGRIIEGNRFQFIFPSEETMENVLRRGPWAFVDRMIVLQRWAPFVDVASLDFIPFWIQIRGIPFQFATQDVIAHIGRSFGMLMEVDYNQEAVARREYARVRVNWDITRPLRFQRHFQFSQGVNTLLRFRYERLRGFCEVCGMLTHDSGNCLIHNGGGVLVSDDDDDDDDDGPGNAPRRHQGVQNGGDVDHSDGDGDEEEPHQANEHNGGIQIREINDEEVEAILREGAQNQNLQNGDHEAIGEAGFLNDDFEEELGMSSEDDQDNGDNAGLVSEIAGSEDNIQMPERNLTPRGAITLEQDVVQGNIGSEHSNLSDLQTEHTMTSYLGKRKHSDSDDEKFVYKMHSREQGESSGQMEESSPPKVLRGAVGPEPPLPP
ncbi:uncharacterized protein LOC112089854 [Eutrema salsugineum]|uniref:uncharacterized protein LOC112089854 n=1 Tax=Eutrema salsugineum TaxID=72664 RepID=UPI000CED4109|nr:uncharacterized protein LOC112089854 [Eutrema salsugineum]